MLQVGLKLALSMLVVDIVCRYVLLGGIERMIDIRKISKVRRALTDWVRLFVGG